MPAKTGNKKNRPNRQQARPVAEVVATAPESPDSSRYAPTAWQGGNVELTLPSGQLCLVRRVGAQKLMEEGVLDNFDSLSSLVHTEHISKKGKSSPAQRKKEAMSDEITIRNLVKDPEKLRQVTAMLDKVVMAAVVAPPILPVPEPDAETGEAKREDGAAYIDWVADEDKAYVMQYVFGGTRDLERFREELAELGDGVDDEPDVEGPAE